MPGTVYTIHVHVLAIRLCLFKFSVLGSCTYNSLVYYLVKTQQGPRDQVLTARR